jgi:hypothetical protein
MGYSSGKDFSDPEILEKYSSAFTLSDMEIFIFPELFFPLVLANVMSPIIWQWRDDPWFHNIEKKSFNYKVNRIKQFIIQNYVFNLDLSTWGLTTKDREINRFRNYIDIDLLKQSNALFGYEGDKYYFDMDIRKHFGLDKYNSDIIPYWKTETVEAMTAFRFRDGFTTGGGECVSLSALYAAAMFVIGRISVDKIFMVATPLHSQTFLVENEGLITNNRRIVTKNMWFNGTSLSAKARRALENEKVTVVSHITGHIHILYNEASIDLKAYEQFSEKLKSFLETDLTPAVFLNFLRFNTKYKSLFQYLCTCSGNPRYILLEKIFEYEHLSKYSVSAETREMLIKEIEGDEFHLSPVQGKILLNDLEELLERKNGSSISQVEDEVRKMCGVDLYGIISKMFGEIREFIHIEPRLPGIKKNFIKHVYPVINPDNTREEIIEKISGLAAESELCMLALYVYRDMDYIDWIPFLKASIERNPVSLDFLRNKSLNEMYDIIRTLPDISIYDGKRLALPDEVWNFSRGDGIEKSILLAINILASDQGAKIEINIDHQNVELKHGDTTFIFSSQKRIKKRIIIEESEYRVE